MRLTLTLQAVSRIAIWRRGGDTDEDTTPDFLGKFDPLDPQGSHALTLKNHLMVRSNYEALVSGEPDEQERERLGGAITLNGFVSRLQGVTS